MDNNVFNHLPAELIRHILSFHTIHFPYDFMKERIIDDTKCASPLTRDDEEQQYTLWFEEEMNRLTKVPTFFGKFKESHHRDYVTPFLVFPSVIFTLDSYISRYHLHKLFNHQVNDAISNHQEINAKSKNSKTKKVSSIANILDLEEHAETSLMMHEMIYLPRMISSFQSIVLSTALPFEDVLVECMDETNSWINTFWSKLPKNLLNNKLQLALHVKNMDRAQVDRFLEKLMDVSFNEFFKLNMKTLYIETECSRFRQGIIEDYETYMSMGGDEQDEDDSLMKGKRMFFIDILNTFPSIEVLKINKMIDDDDLEVQSTLNFKSTSVLSHETSRMAQYFKMYPFKSNKEISQIRLVLTEEEEEAKRQQREIMEDRRRSILEKLTLKQQTNYKIRTCIVNGLKDHEIKQLLQSYACQTHLKTLLIAHTVLSKEFCELLTHSSVQTLTLLDDVFEGIESLESILLHTPVKSLTANNVTYHKPTPNNNSPKTLYSWSEPEGELFKKNNSLVTLKIINCTNLLDPKFTQKLSENRNIRFLTIRGCKLSDEKIRPILRHNRTIEELDITDNKGGSLSAARLTAFHSYRGCRRMRILSDFVKF
ncbi:hypothetical protein NAEGRDRAFT_58677 [Naegleria gruberi]|uniref:Uncharacterized protein n=1 Tax=Naegleria gruberi TaxID=5762 RepID=D2VMJ7_NAEGR|nr:uncharacterized protein NAEGRDRAFT_58677 [Naegleria gruberi]EFC42076.1 hypothetical protein NAEGRDRAFT_58677 [Naegleria gruberi]|eukprot:XP_002674820.1 hypothetical protein NAEGRDRAFT_58677 [Naegleria gruberi strain NEG-M]